MNCLLLVTLLFGADPLPPTGSPMSRLRSPSIATCWRTRC